MKKILPAAVVIFLVSTNITYADPDADAVNGEALHQQKCSSCHFVGGDHTLLYKIENRKIKNYGRLKGQVSMCLQNLNIEWFPEEEQAVLTFLNDQYYHFKK